MTGMERDPIRAEDVIAEVERQWAQPCAGCARGLIGHDIVISLLMGHKDRPHCAHCLAAATQRPLADFARHVRTNVSRLDCFRAGWQHADRRLRGTGDSAAGLWSFEFPMESEDSDDESPELIHDSSIPAAAYFDAGDMSCGDLVLELRNQMRELSAGDVLQVRATDPGAPADLPAWARVTGNTLVRHERPLYWFRRRLES